jgi:hypothetical protein
MALVTGGTAAAASGAELDYVERTTALTITATTAATAQTFITGGTVLYDGATRICIEFFVQSADGTISAIVSLWDGSTELGRFGVIEATTIGGSAMYSRRFLTPTNASHSYLVKAWKTGGNSGLTAGAGGTDTALPAYLRITKA